MSWPTVEELPAGGDEAMVDDLAAALIGIRGAKSNAKVSMKTPILAATLSGPAASVERLRTIESDLRAVGSITGEITWSEGDEVAGVDAELGEPPAKKPR